MNRQLSGVCSRTIACASCVSPEGMDRCNIQAEDEAEQVQMW
ncbi:hypothetical protein [Nostoc sphaeroides]|nr:hypothetical protein [Nostoc sphaeroides]